MAIVPFAVFCCLVTQITHDSRPQPLRCFCIRPCSRRRIMAILGSASFESWHQNLVGVRVVPSAVFV